MAAGYERSYESTENLISLNGQVWHHRYGLLGHGFIRWPSAFFNSSICVSKHCKKTDNQAFDLEGLFKLVSFASNGAGLLQAENLLCFWSYIINKASEVGI